MEERYSGRGVRCAVRDVDKLAGKRVLVIGGGNSTVKSALLAKNAGADVTLIHRRESLRAYPAMVKKAAGRRRCHTLQRRGEGHKRREQVETVLVTDSKTGGVSERAVDWLVICVGTQPDTELARRAGLEMHGSYVRVDRKMMTSKPGVFACGEITGGERHLITAAGEGALAGMAASEYLALEKVRRGEMFAGAKNGKYADEYLAMLNKATG